MPPMWRRARHCFPLSGGAKRHGIQTGSFWVLTFPANGCILCNNKTKRKSALNTFPFVGFPMLIHRSIVETVYHALTFGSTKVRAFLLAAETRKEGKLCVILRDVS